MYNNLFSVWARSVCINESIEKGSVLPFLEVARKNNMSVVVMNPNLSRDPKTKVIIFVQNSYILNLY